MNTEKTKTIVYNNMKCNLQSLDYEKNFEKFCDLEIDCYNKSITKENLPCELSEDLCNFIDIFRKKTINENNEWNFYIDYQNDEIIHCITGNSTKVSGIINPTELNNRKIITIHNHPKGTYSAPSAAKFEILEHEFEDYEIIFAENEYWILESKDYLNKIIINNIKKSIKQIFSECDTNTSFSNSEKNYCYSKQLITFINNLNAKIKIIKREYK